MVHVHAIKFTTHLVLGAPPPILAISSDLLLCFLDVTGLKVVKSLNKNLVGVNFFSVIECLGYVPSPPWTFSKTDFSFSNLDRRVVSAINLASWGSVLVHSLSGY